MHRIPLATNPSSRPFGSPDMTVNEAADAMERLHSPLLLVGQGRTPLGVLSEQEIVSRVLALGLDPNRVHVRDIMLAGQLDARGSFLVEDDPNPPAPIWAGEGLKARDDDADEILTSMLQGKCEECGVFSEELGDVAGQLVCSDCTGFHQALFR